MQQRKAEAEDSVVELAVFVGREKRDDFAEAGGFNGRGL